MRRFLFLGAIGFLTVIMVFAAAGCTGSGYIGGSPNAAAVSPVTGISIASQQSTGIWVTGEGLVTVTPDIANITLGVQSQSASVSDAQSKAAQAMDSVVKAVKGLGVLDNDIKTTRFSISPVYNYDKGTQTLIGYQVTNLVTIKVRKVSDTGTIIDEVAKAGGDLTRIDNIAFDVNDPAPYNKQARDLAMADAGAKATQLATLAGVTLGKPTYINESGGYVPIPTPFERAAPAAVPAPTTPISPGQTQIRLNIQVVYSMQ